MKQLFAATLLASIAIGSVSCRFDPVPEEAIDRLPEEDDDGADATHRSGQPCLVCHSNYEGAEPALAVGGTIYRLDADGVTPIPAPNVLVVIRDSAGAEKNACTNATGNFFVEKDNFEDATFPLTVEAGSRKMRSLLGREGSCAFCHTLPNELSLDPNTGAGRSSAGLILVEAADIGAESRCGPPIATGGNGGGGNGGDGGGGSGGGGNGGGGTGGVGGAGGTGGTGG